VPNCSPRVRQNSSPRWQRLLRAISRAMSASMRLTRWPGSGGLQHSSGLDQKGAVRAPDSVKRLDATVNDTIKSTEEIARATEQVAVSSQKATDDAKAQLGSVEKISSAMSDVSASIEEIASTTMMSFPMRTRPQKRVHRLRDRQGCNE